MHRLRYVIKHKWIVLAAAFMVSFLNFGFAVSMGAMFISMLDTFDEGRAETALVQSLVLSVCYGFGVVGGLLISKFGIRIITYIAAILTATGLFVSFFATSIYQLYGFISTIAGIGFSSMYVAAVLCVGWTFTGSQKPIVLAIQSVGTAVSGFMWPFLLTTSIDAYGLRGTFLILCGIFLNNIPIAIIFSNCKANLDVENRQVPSDTNGHNKTALEGSTTITNTAPSTHTTDETCIGENGIKCNDDCEDIENTKSLNVTRGNIVGESNAGCFRKLCFNKLLWIYIMFMLVGIFTMASIAGFFAVYQDINISNGLSVQQSDITFLSYSLMNILSRLLPVIPAKFSFINLFAAPIMSSLSGVLGQVLFLTQRSFLGSFMAMGLTAVSDGGLVASIQAILFHILPQKRQAVGFGFMLTIIGVSAAAVGPIFGSIRDGTSSYQTVLIATSIVMFVSAVLSLVCLSLSSNCLRNDCKLFTRRKEDESNTAVQAE